MREPESSVLGVSRGAPGAAQTPGVLPFPYRLDAIIDDLILVFYIVGNDFLPNLPTLYIPSGGLTAVFEAYKRTLPQLRTPAQCRELGGQQAMG